MREPEIDGALVGEACVQTTGFTRIVSFEARGEKSMTKLLSLFRIQDEEECNNIEQQVRDLVGEGSQLARRGLQLLRKLTDSLYDLTQPTPPMIERWCRPMLGIVPYLYEEIEASLVLLEKGYVSGAQSCLRSALEASQLLNLVVVDEQAAIQFSKPPEENPFLGPRSASIAYRHLQKEYPECIAGKKEVSDIYQVFSRIAHPTPLITAQTLLSAEWQSAQTALGPGYHPIVTAALIDYIGAVLMIAIHALYFDRPDDAPPVSPDVSEEVDEWIVQQAAYGARMRKRELEEKFRHPIVQQILASLPRDSLEEELARLLGPGFKRDQS